MSKKSDLLVRVRHLNPLPPPPFPPKLFSISTDINRLGEPSYLNQLAASTPFPMIVDSEMGMPLDLNVYEGVWNGNDAALNPVLDPSRQHDPSDIILLAPIKRTIVNGAEKGPSTAEVSWMRNASYIQRKNNARRRDGAEAAEKAEAEIDVSETAHLMSIDKSFADVHNQKVTKIRHPDPKKRHLEVVDSYDILPDEETWANPYIMLKFPERPMAAGQDLSTAASNERLSRALLRPIKEDDQQIMEYYLPTEDELPKLEETYISPAAEDVFDTVDSLDMEEDSAAKIDEVFPRVKYTRVRTYEVITQSMPSKEVLISFHEEETDDVPASDEPMRKKRKGVYFKEIAMRTLLRKTRVQKREEQEERADTWDDVRVGYRLPSQQEKETMESLKESVSDSYWVDGELRRLRGGDNQAEGLGEAIDDEDMPEDSSVPRVKGSDE